MRPLDAAYAPSRRSMCARWAGAEKAERRLGAVTSPRALELVVLLDDDGEPTGVAPKSEVHHSATPLHLAFSCWLVDEQGRTLLTRRAGVKRTWPGAWTNSFCGHPGPDEAIPHAVHRRARFELGADISDPVPELPDFRYRAVMDDGTMENEVCPVYVARLRTRPEPNPAEVADLRWVPFADLGAAVEADPSSYSPWMREQLDALLRAGWSPPTP
jgi:isopentenyl-diphosphate Delta-isomerase